MNCFILKAISTKGEWVEFTIDDVPTPIDEGAFVLLRKPNSPILRLENIRRGDRDTGLYEGDVVKYKDELYLICYERGFYAINKDYIVRLFKEMDSFEVVGTVDTIDIGIPISFKKTLLFKYKNTVFKINDIVGTASGGIIINSIGDTINPKCVKQDCCLTVNKQRAYLGDKAYGGRLCLCKGQLGVKLNGKFLCIQEVV